MASFAKSSPPFSGPVWRFFGSVKLAMMLMAVLIGACVAGTLVESRFDPSVAQAYVYEAPWFVLWLFLLCVNLVCAALVRYPWKPHHYGFVLTHAGIVTILLGAVVGRIWGVEGFVTLIKGEEPQMALTTGETILAVRTPAMQEAKICNLNLSLHPPISRHPLIWNIGEVKVSLLDYTERLGTQTVVEENERDGPPAVRLVMRSAMVPKPVEQWLVMDDPDHNHVSLGSAMIRLARDLPQDQKTLDAQRSTLNDGRNKKSGSQESREVHFAGHPSITGHGGMASRGESLSANALTLFYGEKGLRYEAISSKGIARGTIKEGEEFPLGWADWRGEVGKVFRHATAREKRGPLSQETAEGSIGILAQMRKNEGISTKWIRMGEASDFNMEGENIQVMFGQKLHPLDFAVALDGFEVERNEGTEDPAGFKSHVRFIDARSGNILQREIWMNHPANFPDFPGVSLLGTAYKFSQSSWNPNNLDQTTLQVMRDPGWPFKWIGSLMFCAGIFMMFYLKPHLRASRA